MAARRLTCRQFALQANVNEHSSRDTLDRLDLDLVTQIVQMNVAYLAAELLATARSLDGAHDSEIVNVTGGRIDDETQVCQH